MSNQRIRLAILSGAIPLTAIAASPVLGQPTAASAYGTDEAFATFTPHDDRIVHRIDYSIWTEALRNFVVSMGPPLRKMPWSKAGTLGTRSRHGHNSMYRLEGSMIGFSFMNDEVRDSFTEYREDLQRVADGLDIQSLPRNEQLAYWLNLHNVAMVEQIAKAWPIRQPRDIEIGGVPLDDAKFITVEGVKLSPKDIRTKIVYPNWKSSKVIYGFWRGEIGGPAMQREAFEASTVSGLLEVAAREFANSRRGVENRGSTLHVSHFYEEAAPFYFPDLDSDLRAHLLQFANDEMVERIAKTSIIETTLREHDIADLAGGARDNPFFSSGRLGVGVASLLSERRGKYDYMERRDIPTGIVIFNDIRLPGDPADKGEVE